jgi:phosphatidylethanolamine/phosphatidyl-N-methylethanolamine N-methyltransferase
MQKSVVNLIKKRRWPGKPRLPGRHLFIGAWVRSPRSMGSVTPSSRFLGRKIAQQVDVHLPGWVIELGAGTGTITKALLDHGVKPERLMAIERDRKMSTHLQQHMPNIRVVRADALELVEVLEQQKIHKVSTIVCCLPLLTLPKDVVEAVVTQIFTVLPDGGQMLQYTYGPRSPMSKRLQKQLGLKARRVGQVLFNVPPAVVWSYTRPPKLH